MVEFGGGTARGRPSTIRRTLIGAVAIAAVVVATAVSPIPGAPADAASPMTSDQRQVRRAAFLDVLWVPVGENYPEAIRPEVSIAGILVENERVPAIAGCLRGNGVDVDVVNGAIEYASSSGTPLDLAVTFYACRARFPAVEQVTADLSVEQQNALYRYYADVLSPCLTLAGEQVAPGPGRSEFVRDSTPTWTPYRSVDVAALGVSGLLQLEARCPAVPSWLDFRTP